MQNDWILDVLADLRTFADNNGLDALAQQLEDTRLVAAAEIVLANDLAGVVAHGEDRATRCLAGGTATRARA